MQDRLSDLFPELQNEIFLQLSKHDLYRCFFVSKQLKTLAQRFYEKAQAPSPERDYREINDSMLFTRDVFLEQTLPDGNAIFKTRDRPAQYPFWYLDTKKHTFSELKIRNSNIMVIRPNLFAYFDHAGIYLFNIETNQKSRVRSGRNINKVFVIDQNRILYKTDVNTWHIIDLNNITEKIELYLPNEFTDVQAHFTQEKLILSLYKEHKLLEYGSISTDNIYTPLFNINDVIKKIKNYYLTFICQQLGINAPAMDNIDVTLNDVHFNFIKLDLILISTNFKNVFLFDLKKEKILYIGKQDEIIKFDTLSNQDLYIVKKITFSNHWLIHHGFDENTFKFNYTNLVQTINELNQGVESDFLITDIKYTNSEIVVTRFSFKTQTCESINLEYQKQIHSQYHLFKFSFLSEHFILGNIAGTLSGNALMWNIKTGKIVAKDLIHQPTQVLDILPDGDIVVANTYYRFKFFNKFEETKAPSPYPLPQSPAPN